MRALVFPLSLALLAACTSPKPEPTDTAEGDADTDTDTDTDADTDTHDTSPMDDTITLPDSPLPLTVALRGSASDAANFDTIVCSHPPNNQFQLTYSDSTNSYTWTLRVFVRETFVGRGTYNTNVQVQLLENFSGGRYFAGDSTTAAAEVLVEDFGVNGAYGSITVGELTGDSGNVAFTPQPLPFWCAAIDD